MTYRKDIDGLRAVAVLAVLFYHFFPGALPGGFVGVDVFFVISGYLVTNIIYNDVKKQKFTFAHFYAKRIRRLFPSLITILVFVLLVGTFFLVSDEFKLLGKHILSASTFSSNFVYFFESGYFDKDSDLKPLLHLWSLCIEEQYYLIWPVILLFLNRKKISIAKGLTFLTVLSFILNIFFTKTNPSFAFYMLPSRLWELGCGGLLIFIPSSFNRFKPYCALPGMLLILLSFAAISSSKSFPGFWALAPVLGTMLVIFSDGNSIVTRSLSRPAFVGVGLISYPLYLWHWPMISFANILWAHDVSLGLKWLLIGFCFLLSFLTYKFIETPIRFFSTSKKTICVILGLLATLGTIGFLIVKYEGFPNRLPPVYENFYKTRAEHKSTMDVPEASACSKLTLPIEMCSISKPNQAPTVVLLGDSHANHHYPGLKNKYDLEGENLLLLARNGTMPFYGVKSLRTPDTTLDDAFHYIDQNPSIHTVVLSAFWANYYEEAGIVLPRFTYKNVIEDVQDPKNKNQSQIFTNAMERTLKWLDQRGKKVVIFLDIPSLPFYIDKCGFRPLIKFKKENCSFDLNLKSSKQIGYRNIFLKLDKQQAQIIDPIPMLCPSEVCEITQNNSMLYTDEHHLSAYGSTWLIESFDKKGL